MTREQKKIISIAITLIIALTGYFVSGDGSVISSKNPPKTPKSKLTASVLESLNKEAFYPIERVVDGDTIVVLIEGKEATLRLIGVNTPETVDPRRKVECFGKEASNYAKELLKGRSVKIELDPSQTAFDSFGRVLGYVTTDTEIFVNEALVRDGYAYEYTYNKPYKYQERFKSLEKEARLGEKGLWSPLTCNGRN